ncbi:hypothetical protein ASD8599_01737 [Ascidiaceihabitans donghaensis]|uniref:Phage virion morphogenesis protein n=1 Tax=Ascidiaceihabitans donghaensis TaxID=1510460 RepID=A0A2R8BD47_9RHOB|nr:phage virion morphogenesis protein [Ascidiaceihabitans donghaensis]SPH20996.1 hypothetical protein ASD8599_01737 [Ascidiaceihabitans donghaensis]
MANVTFNDDALQAALRNLDLGLQDKSTLMNQIGEAWAQLNTDRLEAGVSPDGTSFAPRSQATLAAYAAKGISPIGGPLRLTGDMANFIHHDYSPDHAEVGSSAVQAAMMHFGGPKSRFPNLWGDIPARPFVGLAESDTPEITEVIEDYLEGLIE